MSTICPIRDDFNVEITEITEEIFVVLITIIGILTILLSLLLLFLIIGRSPKMTSENRAGLASLQLCFLLCSLHNCCLFQIVPALPFFAGYCVGILCTRLHWDFHLLFCVTIFLTEMTFLLFFICIFNRHQSILHRGSPWRMGNARFVLFTASVTPAMISIVWFYFNGRLSEDDVNAKMESYPSMTWLRSKPGWTVYSLAANPVTLYMSGVFCVSCITTCLMTTALIIHTVRLIGRISNQSKRAQTNIQRATTTLFIQFGIFIDFLLLPVIIVGSQAVVVVGHLGAYPFLIAVGCFFCHGLFISIISIVMSKDHRISIAQFLRTNEHRITKIAIMGSFSRKSGGRDSLQN